MLPVTLTTPPAPGSRPKVEPLLPKETPLPAVPIVMTPAPPTTLTDLAPTPTSVMLMLPPVRNNDTVPPAVAVIVPLTAKFCVSIDTAFDEIVCPAATETAPEPSVVKFKDTGAIID